MLLENTNKRIEDAMDNFTEKMIEILIDEGIEESFIDEFKFVESFRQGIAVGMSMVYTDFIEKCKKRGIDSSIMIGGCKDEA